jgi:hypothetical protein
LSTQYRPVEGVDPDGRFAWLAAAALLFTTDVGYDIHKFVSPIAAKLDIKLGTHQIGLGLDVSVGVPQAAPISYRLEGGATYFASRYGGYGPGWQTRWGGEWSSVTPVAGYARYGGTRYRDFGRGGNLLVEQTVNRATVGLPIWQIQFENDTDGSWGGFARRFQNLPGLPGLQNQPGFNFSDRYRTAAGRLRILGTELGFRLHTGEPRRIGQVDTDGDGTLDARAFTGGSIDEPRRSNGIISLGFGPLNIGWDSEGIRHGLQNRLAHDGFGTLFNNNRPRGNRWPWIVRTDRRPRPFFQFGGM